MVDDVCVCVCINQAFKQMAAIVLKLLWSSNLAVTLLALSRQTLNES